jgi:hypothetical protein
LDEILSQTLALVIASHQEPPSESRSSPNIESLAGRNGLEEVKRGWRVI